MTTGIINKIRMALSVILLLLAGNALYAQENPDRSRGGDLKYTPGPLSTKIYYDGAETIGRVGNEAILKRDVLHQLKKQAYMTWFNLMKQWPKEKQQKEGEQVKKQIFEEYLKSKELYSGILDSYIKSLLFYNDYVVSSPKDQSKEQRKKISEVYEQEYVPKFMKDMGMETRKDFDAFFINELQSTWEQDRRIFVHEVLGNGWLDYNLGEDKFEPTTVDLRRYYEAHLDLYRKEDRVNWGALVVQFSKHPNRQEAYQKIVDMGNKVLQARTRQEMERLFTEVAKGMSEDFFAPQGGMRGWTSKGVLSSKELESAIFSDDLPVGHLSRIIEDSTGYYIILVTQREKASWTPFIQVQDDVRKKLTEDRKKALTHQYEEKLSRRFTIELYNISDSERKVRLEANLKEMQSVTGREPDSGL